MISILDGILWMLRFMAGASIFSFLNAAAYRLPRGEGVVRGRSHCPRCGRRLRAWELIPCISYLALGRRCRGCGMKIAGRYFWMECAGGAAFLVCGQVFGFGETGMLSLRGLLAFGFLGILAVVALIDWETRIIYDRFHIFIVLMGIAALWLFPEHGMTDRMFGAIVISVPMLALAMLVEGAFGGGDIKLMAAGGFLLGWRAVVFAMFTGLVTGGIYCVWMLAGKKLARKDYFAFGPFLAVGLAAALLWGDRVAGWYASLL